MFGFLGKRNKRPRSDEEAPVFEPGPAPTTLREYQNKFNQPAYAAKLHENLNQTYPVTYASSSAAPHHFADVPASSYIPPVSTKDVSSNDEGILKPDILTLDVMCKIIQLPSSSSSGASQALTVLSEVAGPISGVVSLMSISERVNATGAFKSVVKFGTTKALQAALRGSLKSFTTNPYVSHLIDYGPGYVTNAYTAYQGYRLAKNILPYSQTPTLLSACQRSFSDLCKREEIDCKVVYCREAYVTHYKTRPKGRIDLEVYVRLPKALIDQYVRVESEFKRLIENFMVTVMEDTPEEEVLSELNKLIDTLVRSRFEGDISEWLRFISVKPKLASEVGLIGSLLFYYSRDSVWRQVVSSILRVLCSRLYLNVHGPNSTQIVRYVLAQNQNSSLWTSFDFAIRSIIVTLSCNASDPAFQTTIGNALTSRSTVDMENKIDQMAVKVHQELISGLEENERKVKKARQPTITV